MHSKVKFDDFVKVIEEDGMIPDVDRQMLGMKTDHPPQQSSVADIMSKNNRSDVAPENIPYPLGEFDNIASNAYIAIQNLEDIIKMAKTNNVIKDKEPLNDISKELIALKKRVVELTKKAAIIK